MSTASPDLIRAELTPLLSTEELDRLRRFLQPLDQLRFLVGRGLLRLLLGAELDLPAAQVKIAYGPFGKPESVAPPGRPAPHFNVSHAGDLVVLAFSQTHPVGIDVEEVKDADTESIARQVFRPAAYRAWLNLEPAARLDEFFVAWTRQEAALKALGLGFLGPADETATARVSNFGLTVPPGYRGAVALWAIPREEGSALGA